MMLQESLLILVAWQRVLSQLHPPGLEEGVPKWRILESHTRLVLAHGARRSLQIDTVQPMLWYIIQNMHNMHNMHNMTWLPRASVLFQHRNIGTLTVLPVHACVCPRMNFEQEQQFAEPDVIHPQLKSPFRYPWWEDKHHVLPI